NFLESIHFPDSENHKKIHSDLIIKVLAYKEGLKEGKLDKQSIANFLKNWLAFHIVGQDKKYARFSKQMT
ncbi:MAG: bacteriohemerythrin, partial [Bacteriovorax sp.]